MNRQILIDAGIDYEKGMARTMNDAYLYESLLQYMLEDTALARAKAAYEGKDYETLFAAAHELKGCAGNLDMTKVYASASRICDMVRNKNAAVDLLALEKEIKELERVYAEAIDGIKRAMQ